MKYILFSILLLSSCSSSTEEKTKDQSKNKESEPEQDSGSFNKENARELKEAIENNKGGSEIVEYNTVGLNKNCDVALDAYIDDPSKTATNIRKTPGGEVVLQLPYGKDDYFLTIVDQKDGWFKVSSIEGIEVSYDLPEGGAWVHNSVVGAGTRNYGNQHIVIYLLASENSKKLDVIKIETAVHVLEICNDFVKIKTATGNQVGWVKKEWICGNPLTTCA